MRPAHTIFSGEIFMTPNHAETSGPDSSRGVPSFFKYVVVASALCIAGCSAFFSVMGLSMLFAGAATAVIVMAASLEIGKLVASAFLYRYWPNISIPIRIYLTLAVLVLVGITSLGNYGYLARAYEKTHTQITLLESQIASIETEIADTQRQIDGSRGILNKTTDNRREDAASIDKQIVEANDLLKQSLARVQEKRKAAQERRDRDLQAPAQKMADLTAALNQAIAGEEAAIKSLNERLAVMDRAVDAYTKEGGERFLKADSIKKGQDLRDSQKFERATIATQITRGRQNIEQLGSDHTRQVASVDKEAAAVRDQFTAEMAKLDAEEKDLHKARQASLVQLTTKLAAVQNEGKATVTEKDTQVDALYQRIRARNAEIHDLRAQIAGVDIGSYRFVARAFDTGADDVVKWLMLALVLVFDPLAVSLVIGFNIVLLGERPRNRQRLQQPSEALQEFPAGAAVATAGNSSWAVSGLVIFTIIALLATVAVAGYWALKAHHGKAVTSHSVMVPADSFAVLTFHTSELRQSSPNRTLADWLGKSAAKEVSAAINELMKSGIDPDADIYAFARFPSGATASSANGEHPVLLCGFVARVTDGTAAEAALSRVADQLSGALRSASNTAPVLAHSRMMIRCGDGRYMDPEGGFFTFGLRDNAAIMLVEFEGNPLAPRVEDEMRLCLTKRPSGAGSVTQPQEQLPSRAFSRDGAIALWLDAGKFFSLLPKNPAELARFQQLERHLDFELMLKVRSAGEDQLRLSAEYAYQSDRFKNRQQPTPLQLLATLGPVANAGLAGRLMDRCADTLDYDSLIERLRTSLDASDTASAQQVLVEKSITSDRDARFTLSARYNPQLGPPLVSAVQTLLR